MHGYCKINQGYKLLGGAAAGAQGAVVRVDTMVETVVQSLIRGVWCWSWVNYKAVWVVDRVLMT